MEGVIRTAITETLISLGLPPVSFAVEHPEQTKNGDYACNVAMVLSKQVGKAPQVIATELLSLLTDQIEYVEKIEIAGPGFLNFYLTRDFFGLEIERVNNEGENWGKNNLNKNEQVLIEYTSPNLFKPLHIGNLVGNIIGESLTRVFEYSGADVVRLNYPSDIGLTVAKAVWGLKKTAGDPRDINQLGEAYRYGSEAYENDEVAKTEIVEVNQALYAGTNEELNQLKDWGVLTSKMRLDEICKKLGTVFNKAIFESNAAPKGIKIVNDNKGQIFKESEGAVVYEGEKVGLHTRVFLNSKGLPTYEAKDLGNFAIKQEAYPDWTTSIIVTGNEQTEYFKVLYSAIREIFPEARDKTLEHIPTGFLTLSTGKMSSRKGNVLTGESLLEEMEEAAREKAAEARTDDLDKLTEEVAVAALKYQILRQGPGTNIIFDKEKALSFEGDSGPYLQYTHARICSVLEKARAAGLASSIELAPASVYEVERIIYQFPEVVEEALKERAPHKVTGYLTELAAAFNSFYAQEKIADKEDTYAPYKIAVAEAVKQTLKNGLWILAIKAPEQM